jgi:DNA (cytosine-5)-methyltransferase 1
MISLEQVDNKLRHKEATKKGYAEAGEGEGLDLTFPESKTRRGRAMKDKSNCLTAASHEMGVVTCDMVANQ